MLSLLDNTTERLNHVISENSRIAKTLENNIIKHVNSTNVSKSGSGSDNDNSSLKENKKKHPRKMRRLLRTLKNLDHDEDSDFMPRLLQTNSVMTSFGPKVKFNYKLRSKNIYSDEGDWGDDFEPILMKCNNTKTNNHKSLFVRCDSFKLDRIKKRN